MAKQATPRKRKAKAPAKVTKFFDRMFIPNYGFVDAGDELTKEMKEAWEGWTKVPIANYTK